MFSAQSESTGAYRYYVLFILMLTYLFSYMDRQIMSILIEDIGAEFSLSDTQRGLLMGLAFALFYAGLGVPVAWLADRYSRRNIIAAAVTIWSAATALCAAAGGFASLFLARVGVGVGEAGGAPPAQSMIGDYFKRSELMRALSVHSLGLTFGAFFGLALGGAIADAIGWRMTFVAVGLPGVALGAVVYLTVREPQRGQFDDSFDAKAPSPAIKDTLRSLRSNKPYLGALIGATFQVFLGYVVTSWGAAIMIRNFGMTKSEVGLLFGLAILIGGSSGMLISGVLCDKLGQKDARWRAWIPGVAVILSIPAYLLAMFAPNPIAMTFSLGCASFFNTMGLVAAFGIIQTSVRSDERALGSAIQFFFGNLFGLGFGPTIAGWLSELLKPQFGALSLNYSVAILSVVLLFSAAAFFWAAEQLQEHSYPAPQQR